MKRLTTILLVAGLLITPALALAVSIDFDVVGGTVDTTFDSANTWTINSIIGLNIFQITATGTAYDGLYSAEAVGGSSTLYLNYDGSGLSVYGYFQGEDPFTDASLSLSYTSVAPLLTASVGPLTFGENVAKGEVPFTLSGLDYKEGAFLSVFGFSGTTGSYYPWNFDLNLDFIFNGDDTNQIFIADGTLFNTPVPEPGTMALLGSGLVGLAGWGRKRFRG